MKPFRAEHLGNIMHWHGAAADSAFTHVSIRPLGTTRWTKIDPLA